MRCTDFRDTEPFPLWNENLMKKPVAAEHSSIDSLRNLRGKWPIFVLFSQDKKYVREMTRLSISEINPSQP